MGGDPVGGLGEAGLLVEVRLGLLTLDGCMETVDVFLRMEPLCVLNRIMGLQTEGHGESQPKRATQSPHRGRPCPGAAPVFKCLCT